MSFFKKSALVERIFRTYCLDNYSPSILYSRFHKSSQLKLIVWRSLINDLSSVLTLRILYKTHCCWISLFFSNSFFPSSSAPIPLLPSNISLVSLGCPFHPRGYALSSFSLDSSASASPAILTVFTSKHPLDSCPVGVWCELPTHCSSFLSGCPSVTSKWHAQNRTHFLLQTNPRPDLGNSVDSFYTFQVLA